MQVCLRWGNNAVELLKHVFKLETFKWFYIEILYATGSFIWNGVANYFIFCLPDRMVRFRSFSKNVFPFTNWDVPDTPELYLAHALHEELTWFVDRNSISYIWSWEVSFMSSITLVYFHCTTMAIAAFHIMSISLIIIVGKFNFVCRENKDPPSSVSQSSMDPSVFLGKRGN